MPLARCPGGFPIHRVLPLLLSQTPAMPSIEVGTSNTAPTPTDYQLNAQVGSAAGIVTETTDLTHSLFITQGPIPLSSSVTIQEIGFFYNGEIK